MHKSNRLTPAEATRRGYRVLAGPYAKHEDHMLYSVLEDMRRGRIEAVIIECPGAQREVWRTTSGWLAGAED